MDAYKNQIVYLLKKAICNNCKINPEDFKEADWKKIIEEADEHCIKSLVYLGMKDNNFDISDDILKSLSREVFISAITENRKINEIIKALEELNRNEIEFIGLKGLVLRYVYSNPDLRIMSDADILIHKEDLQKVDDVLLNIGYKKEENNTDYHIVYKSAKGIFIEVHWKLVKEKYKYWLKGIEDTLWTDTISINIKGIKVVSMNYENLIIYLLSHMASHIVEEGIGLRQLCDLALLINSKGKIINWTSVRNKADTSGILKFAEIIFTICKEFFNVDVPCNFNILTDNWAVLDLENIIFEGGVYGKRLMPYICKAPVRENDKEDSKGIKFFKTIFQAPYKTSTKYTYAKKSKLLLPIAWVHHLVIWIIWVIKQFFLENEKNKVGDNKIVFIIKSIISSNKKRKLIKELQL